MKIDRFIRGRVVPYLGILAFILTGCKIEQRSEIFHLRGSYNYQFYKHHAKDYTLTTVAHWAHGKISDILLEDPKNPKKADEDFFEKSIWFLKHPSKVEPHQDYVAPVFARMAWKAIRVVDWAHQLHEQLYDIMTDPRIPTEDKKKWIDLSVKYYLSEPSIAFSPAPFEEVIMNRVGLMRQPWFKAFRTNYPRTTELFWAFHWWHPAVYEVQILNSDISKQKQGIKAIDQLFLNDLLTNPPQRMLLSREVMPRFSQLTPEAANIFDNLHMFHGIVYDILASPLVKDKKKEIYRMIDLMTVRPGDGKLADNFSAPNPEMDPLQYYDWLQDAGGEMARIMGHSHKQHDPSHMKTQKHMKEVRP